VSPSGSAHFCWSLFDILRSATLLNGIFPVRPIEIRKRGTLVGAASAKEKD
jgi:hypothetical protein